jgi:general secretion pathway protein N
MRLLAVLALPATAVALTTPSITDLSNDEAETLRPSPSPAAPRTPPAVQVQVGPSPSANPLWGIPLKHLSNTRDRPIFSPSRRPPPPAVVATPVAVAPPPPKPKDPEQPNLVLLGTIVNGEDGYAIFMDQAKKTPVRVRIGSSYDGWVLHGIKSGIAALEKAKDSAILTLPKRPGDQGGLLGRRIAAPTSTLMPNGRSLQFTGQTPEPPPVLPRQFPPPNPPFGPGPPSRQPPNSQPVNLR